MLLNVETKKQSGVFVSLRCPHSPSSEHFKLVALFKLIYGMIQNLLSLASELMSGSELFKSQQGTTLG